MTMTPEDFRRHFEDAVGTEPEAPGYAAAAVADGHRTLRRRRVAAAVMAVVLLTGTITTLAALGGGDRTQDPAPAPTSPPTTASDDAGSFPDGDELLRLCRTGTLQDRRYARYFFSSGTPEIRVVSSVDDRGSAVLESADDRLWAWCRVTPGRPDETGMDVSLRAGIVKPNSMFYFGGLTCGLDRKFRAKPCATFEFRWAEQLAPRVAEVSFVMADGEEVRFPTPDGYACLEYRGRLSRPVRGAAAERFDVYRRITYFNARGSVIATTPRRGDIPGTQRIHPRGSQLRLPS